MSAPPAPVAAPRFLSLFEYPVDGVVPFLRESIGSGLVDGYAHVVATDSTSDIALLAGRPPGRTLRRQTPWVPARTSLHEVSLSGHRDAEHGNAILEDLFARPASFRAPVEHLHVLLLEHPATADGADLYELVERPTARWADLVQPEALIKRLRRNLSVIRHRDTLLSWGFGDIAGHDGRIVVALNLVGPSGTGKSLAARVIARELGRPLMVVDYAQLESKYVGDTSKHIKSVFADARRLRAVLFFDEADSFLGRRGEEVRQSYDAAVNGTRSVMLMELQSFDGVVLFATNLIKNYDPAFRRRILDHIEFPLPDAAARGRILDRHTPAGVPGRAALDFAHLGELSETLSGGELANVAYQACLDLLARMDDSAEDTPAEPITPADFTEAIRAAQRARELLPDQIPKVSVFTTPDTVE